MQEIAQERQMTDFVALLMDMRSGQVAADIKQTFNEVLTAVLETAGAGELTVKFKIKPAKLGMGGAVIEVETEHETKLKRPELKVGRAVFFVTREGQLTRDDPAQVAMFEAAEPETRRAQ
jgi:hypothetical protein